MAGEKGALRIADIPEAQEFADSWPTLLLFGGRRHLLETVDVYK